jgi:hypothetical protein
MKQCKYADGIDPRTLTENICNSLARQLDTDLECFLTDFEVVKYEFDNLIQFGCEYYLRNWGGVAGEIMPFVDYEGYARWLIDKGDIAMYYDDDKGIIYVVE